MTLAETILRKVQSNTSIRKKYSSPPPEVEETIVVAKRPKRKHVRFGHVSAAVDTSPPPLYPMRWYSPLSGYKRNIIDVYSKNLELVMAIKRQHFSRGKVDSRWNVNPKKSIVYYMNRVNFYKRVQRENEVIYRRLCGTEPRLVPTSQHRRHWAHNRRVIVAGAQAAFVLFPPVPKEELEDEAFATPPGMKRPRVYITLRIRDHAEMGDLTVELFTDTSPKTCQLFLELVDGDGLGFGYVGTCFFRKVPGLYWAGGDVAYDNGFGCYAQRGRRVPIGAENFHFPHSMAGLLSMKVTKDDEMCGMFNITFKPMPQFDLHNVVFGRVIRPCSTFDNVCNLGSPLSSWPVVEIVRTRRRVGDGWVTGAPNTRIVDINKLHCRRYEPPPSYIRKMVVKPVVES